MLALAACTGPLETVSAEHGRAPSSSAEQAVRTESKPQATAGGQAEEDDGGKTVKAVLPEDVLSKKDLDAPPPKYEDWFEEGSDPDGTGGSTTAGALPAV